MIALEHESTHAASRSSAVRPAEKASSSSRACGLGQRQRASGPRVRAGHSDKGAAGSASACADSSSACRPSAARPRRAAWSGRPARTAEFSATLRCGNKPGRPRNSSPPAPAPPRSAACRSAPAPASFQTTAIRPSALLQRAATPHQRGWTPPSLGVAPSTGVDRPGRPYPRSAAPRAQTHRTRRGRGGRSGP